MIRKNAAFANLKRRNDPAGFERLFLLPSESDEKFKKSLIKQIPGTESTSSIFPVTENKAPGA